MLEEGNKVPVKNLFEKRDFMITDQTSHNLELEDILAK